MSKYDFKTKIYLSGIDWNKFSFFCLVLWSLSQGHEDLCTKLLVNTKNKIIKQNILYNK